MKITGHLAALEIMRDNSAIYPVLIWDDQNLALIDTGFPGQFELFQQAIAACGFMLEDLTHILLTHQDLDHIGCLKELLACAPNARVYAHKMEASCIRGDVPPSKMVAKAPSDPTEQEKAQFDERVANYKKFADRVDHELEDGQVIPICGGILVVHTPGHTDGHVCYYMERDKVLMTGDTINLSNGSLVGPTPVHTVDMELARRSNRKLIGIAASTLISYHGGVFQGDIAGEIERLTAE